MCQVQNIMEINFHLTSQSLSFKIENSNDFLCLTRIFSLEQWPFFSLRTPHLAQALRMTLAAGAAGGGMAFGSHGEPDHINWLYRRKRSGPPPPSHNFCALADIHLLGDFGTLVTPLVC